MENQTTILIFDDVQADREALVGALIPLGFQLIFSGDGEETYQKALEYTPDLILLNGMMPGMDGFEVCKKLRNNPLLTEIPILMVTALDDRSSKLKGIESGADDFIAKPFDRIELQARLKTITRLNRYRRLLLGKARFLWVLDRSNDGYIITDSMAQILYANPSAHNLLSLPEEGDEQGLLINFHDWVRKHYSTEPEEEWELWRKNVFPSSPVFLIKPETQLSEPVWLEVEVVDLPWGEEGRVLIRISDISEIVSVAQEMWSFNSTITHKLRTPLTHLALGIELINRISKRLGADDLVEIGDTLQSGINRLRSEIEEVIAYINAPLISQTCSTFSICDLEKMVQAIAEQLSISRVKVSIDRSLEELSILFSNRSMEKVLFEIMENSKKFHPKLDPTIEVTTRILQNRAMTLRIINDGTTLSPSQLKHAWIPYYQGERHFTGEVDGMGLGLSTVYSLVWGVGGKCHMYNREDQQGIITEIIFPLIAVTERDCSR